MLPLPLKSSPLCAHKCRPGVKITGFDPSWLRIFTIKPLKYVIYIIIDYSSPSVFPNFRHRSLVCSLILNEQSQGVTQQQGLVEEASRRQLLV